MASCGLILRHTWLKNNFPDWKGIQIWFIWGGIFSLVWASMSGLVGINFTVLKKQTGIATQVCVLTKYNVEFIIFYKPLVIN